MRTSIVLPLLALSVRVLAIPPACLLNAVNTQDEPSDLEAICGSDAEDVQQAIVDLCGDSQSAAQSEFIATCSAAGSSVAPFTATTTNASPTGGTFVYTTAVYDSDCDCTTTLVTSQTGGTPAQATGDSDSASATGASETGNIAARDTTGIGSFAAAAVAVAGAIAAL